MNRSRVYVASSWRNPYQPGVVSLLRLAGHEVYDFRNPKPGDNGFHWSAIDPDWTEWSGPQYRSALSHPVAESGFSLDINALRWAEVTVCVLPCGRSAHLELGYACGVGQRTIVYIPPGERVEPELMYKACSAIVLSEPELLVALETVPA